MKKINPKLFFGKINIDDFLNLKIDLKSFEYKESEILKEVDIYKKNKNNKNKPLF